MGFGISDSVVSARVLVGLLVLQQPDETHAHPYRTPLRLHNLRPGLFGARKPDKAHAQPYRTPYACTACGQAFSDTSNLATHCKNMHGLDQE